MIHRLSTYAAVRGMGNYPEYVQRKRMSRLMCKDALILSLFIFLAAFLSHSVLFVFVVIQPYLYEKSVYVFFRNAYFSITRSIFVVMK